MERFYLRKRVCLCIDADSLQEAEIWAQRWGLALNQHFAKADKPVSFPDKVVAMTTLDEYENITEKMRGKTQEIQSELEAWAQPYLEEGEKVEELSVAELFKRATKAR